MKIIYVIQKSSIEQVIDNQKMLNESLNVQELIHRYDLLIGLEIDRVINYIKSSNKIDNILLKQYLTNIFIIALELSIKLNQQSKADSLMRGDWIKVTDKNEVDYGVMVYRLRVMKDKFADLFEDRFGLFIIRAVLDIVILYGYKDFMGYVVREQLRLK